MRLFTGIDLPEDVRERLERLLMHLRPAAHLKWSPGVQPACDAEVHRRMAGRKAAATRSGAATRSRPVPAIPVEVKSLGWFPNTTSSARVLGRGARRRCTARRWLHDIDAALTPLGIAKEDRAFTAHLTLGANQRAGAAASLAQRHRSSWSRPNSDRFVADRFYLFRSQPGSAGSIYTKLSEYPFRAK